MDQVNTLTNFLTTLTNFLTSVSSIASSVPYPVILAKYRVNDKVVVGSNTTDQTQASTIGRFLDLLLASSSFLLNCGHGRRGRANGSYELY